MKLCPRKWPPWRIQDEWKESIREGKRKVKSSPLSYDHFKKTVDSFRRKDIRCNSQRANNSIKYISLVQVKCDVDFLSPVSPIFLHVILQRRPPMSVCFACCFRLSDVEFLSPGRSLFPSRHRSQAASNATPSPHLPSSLRGISTWHT